jgi:hypothetical protein
MATILQSLRDDCFIPMFQERPQLALKFFCENTVPKIVWMDKYKEFPPIESVGDSDISQWRVFVDEVFPNEDDEFKLSALKIIYTVGLTTN